MLRKELQIFTFKDLLEHFPIRHIDKTKVDKIASLNYMQEYAQVAGRLTDMQIVGEKRGRRLVAHLKDDTGEIELVWFQGISWVEKTLEVGKPYLVFGKLSFFMNKPQIAHPEVENYTVQKADGKAHLEPVYPTTEKLKAKGLNGRSISKLTYALLQVLTEKDLPAPRITPTRLRRPTQHGCMSTIEAIAAALSLLEGPELAAPLWVLHAELVRRADAMRGRKREIVMAGP